MNYLLHKKNEDNIEYSDAAIFVATRTDMHVLVIWSSWLSFALYMYTNGGAYSATSSVLRKKLELQNEVSNKTEPFFYLFNKHKTPF